MSTWKCQNQNKSNEPRQTRFGKSPALVTFLFAPDSLIEIVRVHLSTHLRAEKDMSVLTFTIKMSLRPVAALRSSCLVRDNAHAQMLWSPVVITAVAQSAAGQIMRNPPRQKMSTRWRSLFANSWLLSRLTRYRRRCDIICRSDARDTCFRHAVRAVVVVIFAFLLQRGDKK